MFECICASESLSSVANSSHFITISDGCVQTTSFGTHGWGLGSRVWAPLTFHSKRSVSIAFQRPEWSSGRCLSPFLSFKTLSFYCVSAPRVVQRGMFESILFIQNAQFLSRFSAQSGPAGTFESNPCIQNAQFLLRFSAQSGPVGDV